MIVITGAAGFIGSCMVGKLNQTGFDDIIVVDDFSNESKNKNLGNKKYIEKIHRDEFFSWLKESHRSVNFIYHIGARTDTTEFDKKVFDKLNLNYTKEMWEACSKYNIPLLYASSAATYGMGEHGYDDNHEVVDKLKPLNPYGESKNEFDKWALQQDKTPPFWYGMKFFNVYGPNEYHKGRMASVILHAYDQILSTGQVKLFRSHHPDFEDGKQLRDFVYVMDVVEILHFLMKHGKNPGLYNLGTGKARTFLDLATSVFRAMDMEPKIKFIDTPEDIRDKYQYFTEARMEKLRSTGYAESFYTLEDGIDDYVKNYLIPGTYY